MLVQTTTVTVTRPAGSGDPYEVPGTALVARNVPAHVSGISATGQTVGGAQEVVNAQLFTTTDVQLRKADRVVDDATGESYTVQWTVTKIGLGLDYQKAGLRSVDGGANA